MNAYWIALCALLAIYVVAAVWVVVGNFLGCDDFTKLFFGKHDQDD